MHKWKHFDSFQIFLFLVFYCEIHISWGEEGIYFTLLEMWL